MPSDASSSKATPLPLLNNKKKKKKKKNYGSTAPLISSSSFTISNSIILKSKTDNEKKKDKSLKATNLSYWNQFDQVIKDTERIVSLLEAKQSFSNESIEESQSEESKARVLINHLIQATRRERHTHKKILLDYESWSHEVLEGERSTITVLNQLIKEKEKEIETLTNRHNRALEGAKQNILNECEKWLQESEIHFKKELRHERTVGRLEFLRACIECIQKDENMEDFYQQWMTPVEKEEDEEEEDIDETKNNFERLKSCLSSLTLLHRATTKEKSSDVDTASTTITV